MITDTPTLEALHHTGRQIRKHAIRTAICQDRARKWIALARQEGSSETDIRSALGMSMDEYMQLVGTA